MYQLPVEIKIKILCYLGRNDLIQLSLVNKEFRNISLSNNLWYPIVKKYFGQVDMIGNTYYKTYNYYLRNDIVYILKHMGTFIGVYGSRECAEEDIINMLRCNLHILNESKYVNYFLLKNPDMNSNDIESVMNYSADIETSKKIMVTLTEYVNIFKSTGTSGEYLYPFNYKVQMKGLIRNSKYRPTNCTTYAKINNSDSYEKKFYKDIFDPT